MDTFTEVKRNTCFLHILCLTNAYTWAFKAWDHLALEFKAWHNFIKVMRGLQCNLLELLAFVDWWHDIQQGDKFQPPFCTPTHGAVFDNENIYASHTHWSITTYLIVCNDCFALEPNKQVNLSLCNSSQMDVMSVQLLMHSLHLWYHPSHIEDIYTTFKSAACGYANHLDTFNLTKGFKRKLDKKDN